MLCPRCGAAARGEVTWCTQCYLDLRRVDEPGPEPVHPPVPSVPGVPAAPGAAVAPTWPCPCGTANSFDGSACTDCGAVFLSRLRSEGAPSLVLPLVGDVARFSRNQRLAGACGAAFLLSVLLGLLAVLV